MLKNRHYLGVSFAVSHAFHAFAIISLALITSGAAPKPSFAEILDYIFIIAMTATSFERTTAWLNRLHQRAWKILHTVGIYYLWLAFTYAFSTNLAKSMLYLPFVILLVLAMMLRLFALVIYPKMQSKIEAEPSNQVYKKKSMWLRYGVDEDDVLEKKFRSAIRQTTVRCLLSFQFLRSMS